MWRCAVVRSDWGEANLLSQRLARWPISADEAVRYVIEVGAARHKIHSRGTGARRAIPSLHPCIALPGEARILQATTSPEDRAAYGAPEQIRGAEPDVLSDVFAYGAQLDEIGTGNRAFTRTGAELAEKILSEAPALYQREQPDGSAVQCRPHGDHGRSHHPGQRHRGRAQHGADLGPPGGKWLAYQSDASGRNEVRVQPFDGISKNTSRFWKVSKDGGLPHWRSDSRELTSDGCGGPGRPGAW